MLITERVEATGLVSDLGRSYCRGLDELAQEEVLPSFPDERRRFSGRSGEIETFEQRPSFRIASARGRKPDARLLVQNFDERNLSRLVSGEEGLAEAREIVRLPGRSETVQHL